MTAALVFGAAPGAWAVPAGPRGGAAISLDRASVRVGQRVLVTLSGWTARNVTLSVCGNLSKRGSGDCNLAASQALKLLTEPTFTELTIFAPPGTCPCVIRSSSAAQDEVAVAPIDIIGVPVGPVVGPVFQLPLDIAVTVRSTHHGLVAWLRSALGGPTTYAVTVSVHNLTTEKLPGITVSATAGRTANDSSASFDVPPPGDLAPGQVWEHVSRVRVPAPVLGHFYFHAVVSGAGPPVEAVAARYRLPWGFVLLAVVFVVDVIAMALYFVARRGRRRHLEFPGQPEPLSERQLIDAGPTSGFSVLSHHSVAATEGARAPTRSS